MFVFEKSEIVLYERINPLGETSQVTGCPMGECGEGHLCPVVCQKVGGWGLLDRICVTDASKEGV